MRALVVSVLALAACGAPPPPDRRSSFDLDPGLAGLLRVRCATDGREVITTWRGDVHAHVPGEAPRRLFAITGMNIARCVRDAEGWYLTSRELMLYRDPGTGDVLDRWRNPWTDVEVAVVHVANDPVQNRLGGAVAPVYLGDEAVYALEIPVSYPNPLAADPALQAYAPDPVYAAIEMFELRAPASEVGDPTRASVSTMRLSWYRVGPWLPWMQQGERAGVLVYSAVGERVASFDALPLELRRVIAERVPAFRRAPSCWLDTANVTSWTYFARHVAAYRAGAAFPIAAPASDDRCADPR